MTDASTPPISVPSPTPQAAPPKRPWTILGRLSKAVREQNWFAVVLEVLIVVLGVVIGFQITAWGQAEADRSREQDYLRQLAADLHATEQGVAENDSLNLPATKALIKFSRAFSADPRPPVDSLFVWGWEGLFLIPYSPVVGTAEALVSTGDIRLIRNDTLRSEIISHLEVMRQASAISQSVMLAYIEEFQDYRGHFDFSRAAQVALSPAELDSLARADDLFADAPSPGRPPFPDPETMLDDLDLYVNVRNLLATRGDLRVMKTMSRTSTLNLAALVEAELNR